MADPEYLVAPYTYSIPENLESEVGRIIVRWAFFEDTVQAVIWELMCVSAAVGRITTREPRIQERLIIIKELTKLRGLELPARWKDLEADAVRLSDARNKLAHGVWMQMNENQWCIVNTNGNYTPQSRQEKINRKIEPTTLNINLTDLQNISYGIAVLSTALIKFEDYLKDKRQTLP